MCWIQCNTKTTMKSIWILITLLSAGFATHAQSVDSLKLMQDVKQLSSNDMQGRMAGTKGSRKAQIYILDRFKNIGLQPLYNTYEQPFFFPYKNRRIMGTNLMGYVKGTGSGWIVISAHYDHLGIAHPPVNGDSIYNGADDNASGVAGLLALATYFQLHPPRYNLLFVAFDAEEEELQGSAAFVRQSKDFLKNVRLLINLDMISHTAKDELYACGTKQCPWLKPFLEQADSDHEISLLYGHDDPDQGKDNWINQSDQGSFYSVKIPFVYFGVEDHPNYHQVTDEFKTITPSFFYHAVRVILRASVRVDEYLGVKLPPRNKWIMKENVN